MKNSNEKTKNEFTVELNLRVDDPALDRKRAITDVVQWYENKPLPSIVEISESGTCNRSCSFCPRSALNLKTRKNLSQMIL